MERSARLCLGRGSSSGVLCFHLQAGELSLSSTEMGGSLGRQGKGRAGARSILAAGAHKEPHVCGAALNFVPGAPMAANASVGTALIARVCWSGSEREWLAARIKSAVKVFACRNGMLLETVSCLVYLSCVLRNVVRPAPHSQGDLTIAFSNVCVYPNF